MGKRGENADQREGRGGFGKGPMIGAVGSVVAGAAAASPLGHSKRDALLAPNVALPPADVKCAQAAMTALAGPSLHGGTASQVWISSSFFVRLGKPVSSPRPTRDDRRHAQQGSRSAAQRPPAGFDLDACEHGGSLSCSRGDDPADMKMHLSHMLICFQRLDLIGGEMGALNFLRHVQRARDRHRTAETRGPLGARLWRDAGLGSADHRSLTAYTLRPRTRARPRPARAAGRLANSPVDQRSHR